MSTYEYRNIDIQKCGNDFVTIWNGKIKWWATELETKHPIKYTKEITKWFNYQHWLRAHYEFGRLINFYIGENTDDRETMCERLSWLHQCYDLLFKMWYKEMEDNL